MLDRKPTERNTESGSVVVPSGCDLPMCLESTFGTYERLWARLAGDNWIDQPEMSSVKSAIEDLAVYYEYRIEKDGKWVRLSVVDCAALERARLDDEDSLAIGGWEFDLKKITLAGSARISFAQSRNKKDEPLRVRRSDYLVRKPADASSGGGGVYSREELLVTVKGQVLAGLRGGYEKFVELHEPYHDAPVAFAFLLTSRCREFAQYAMAAFMESLGDNVPEALRRCKPPDGHNAFVRRATAMDRGKATEHKQSLITWL